MPGGIVEGSSLFRFAWFQIGRNVAVRSSRAAGSNSITLIRWSVAVLTPIVDVSSEIAPGGSRRRLSSNRSDNFADRQRLGGLAFVVAKNQLIPGDIMPRAALEADCAIDADRLESHRPMQTDARRDWAA